jgi:hemoglobin/transferrin/lactoferrin receptor protein
MRGLLGNSYAKILINDVPIKPFVVNGMLIGAQLPIREAERIEVIYGPAATLYGADASAGVINIILKEKERPVYVQSDMGFGALGFENLDVMFSGKIGKNQHVITLQAFGSYTAMRDRNIKYDLDSLYNPNIYQRILRPLSAEVSYINRPNYVGTDSVPLLGELPHESNSLGLTMRYRDLELSFFRFSRQDHSSLGLSPYAVSYANPLNFFGENINSIRLRFQKPMKRLNLRTGLHLLTYNTNDRSSYSYVVPLINFVQQSALIGNSNADSLSEVIDNRYFSRSRFSSANSTEIHGEALLNY